MNQEWYKNPTLLVVGGVALFAAFIVLRSQNSTPTSTTTTSTTSQQQPASTPNSNAPLGAYETYLDGNGVAHQIATGPYYYYNGYQAIPGPSQLTPPYSAQTANASLV